MNVEPVGDHPISDEAGTSPGSSGQPPESATSPEETPEAGTLDAETTNAEIEDPDRDTVAQVVSGDRDAFNTLVQRHQDRIFTRCYFMVRHRETAADLTQEAFMKAYQNLAGFRGEAKFSTWLAKIATNVTLHHFERQRAQKRSGRVFSIHGSVGADGDESEIAIPDHSTNPVDAVTRDETKSAIVSAMAELEDEFRIALALRELNGMSYQEISEHLGIPIGTVKSKIFRARQTLQEKLKELR